MGRRKARAQKALLISPTVPWAIELLLETDVEYGKSLGVGRTQSTEKTGRNY